MRLFCFGYGNVARRVAARLDPQGWKIAGTVPDPGRAAGLRALGVDAFAYDAADPAALAGGALDGATHLLISVPPPDGVLPALAARLAEIPWIGYLSTAGVYGDAGGGWVDWRTPVAPRTERSARRVEAEAQWLALPNPAHVFRLSSLYGPRRNAVANLRAGTVAHRISKPGQMFSRIHVEDVVRTIAASIARPNPGAIYDVADDEPAGSDEVIRYAAELLGIEPPPLVPFEQAAPEMSAMARSFYTEARRVRNDRIKSELGVELAYPTYREGLRSLV